MRSLFSSAAASQLPENYITSPQIRQSILRYAAEHRTFNADHLQRKMPRPFSSVRRAREALDCLVEDKELKITPSPFNTGGRPRNTYIATSKSLRSIDPDIEALVHPERTPPHRPTPKRSHLAHELLITEYCQQVTEITAQRRDLSLQWLERSSLRKHPVFRSFIPDAGYQYHCFLGNMIEFFEALSGVWTYDVIKVKVESFWHWWKSQPAHQWLMKQYLLQHPESNPVPLCRMRFLVHNRKTGNHLAHLRRVLRATLDVPKYVRDQIFVTSVQDLDHPRNLNDSIWYSAGDLNPLAAVWGRLSDAEKKRHLATELSLLPQHRLFPNP